MTTPSVTNSAVNAADSSNDVEVSLTLSGGTGRVVVGFAMGWDAQSNPSFGSVVFDLGGSDEAAMTHESAADLTYYTGVRYLRVEVWYYVVPDSVSSGTKVIDFNTSALWNRVNSVAWEVADADTTDPIGASGTNNDNTDTISVTVNATAANSLIGVGGHMYEEVTFTAGSGDTEETELNHSLCSSWSGYTTTTGSGNYTVSATSSDSPTTDHWIGTGVEILEAAGAPARTTRNTDSNPLGLRTAMSWRITP